jgi:type VI secretion system protein VasD
MKVGSTIGKLLAAASLLWLASCSSTGIMGDGVTDLTLKITVSGDVNPDENGRASPVFLQVVELRDSSTFKDADYLGLYQDARSELGATFIHSTEIGPMFPNSTRTEKLRLNTATAVVGFLGEFNRYSDMETSQSVELKPGKDKKINILIDGSGVHLN